MEVNDMYKDGVSSTNTCIFTLYKIWGSILGLLWNDEIDEFDINVHIIDIIAMDDLIIMFES